MSRLDSGFTAMQTRKTAKDDKSARGTVTSRALGLIVANAGKHSSNLPQKSINQRGQFSQGSVSELRSGSDRRGART
jgi:hypothetical protein